jgi:hypothetical protein
MHLPTFWCDGESSFCIVEFGENWETKQGLCGILFAWFIWCNFFSEQQCFPITANQVIIFQYHLDMAMAALATRKHVNCELLFVMGLWPRQFWMGCFSLQGNGCATKNYHSLQWTSQIYHFHHGLWKFVIRYIWFLYSCHSIIIFLFSSFFLQLVRQWIKTNQ